MTFVPLDSGTMYVVARKYGLDEPVNNSCNGKHCNTAIIVMGLTKLGIHNISNVAVTVADG